MINPFGVKVDLAGNPLAVVELQIGFDCVVPFLASYLPLGGKRFSGQAVVSSETKTVHVPGFVDRQ